MVGGRQVINVTAATGSGGEDGRATCISLTGNVAYNLGFNPGSGSAKDIIRVTQIGSQCSADIDGDLDVDFDDFTLLTGEFGRTDCSFSAPCQADTDLDGDVDFDDLVILTGQFNFTFQCVP